MADPGYGGLDLSQLQGLLSSFGPTDEEKHQAQMAAIAQFGLGLLGTRKGQELQRVGESADYALQGRQNALQMAMKQKQEGLQSAASALGLMGGLQQYNDAQSERGTLQRFYGQNGSPALPTVPPAAPLGFGMNDRSGGLAPPPPMQPPAALPQGAMPQGAPPPGVQPPPTMPAPPTAPTKQSKFEMYSSLSDQMFRDGNAIAGQKYADIAEKFRPQLDKQTTLTTPDGKRVVVNVYKDGTTQIVPDLNPDKEKLVQVDMGSKTAFADPFSGNIPQGAAMYTKDMSPGQVAENKLGYARLAEEQRYHNLEQGIGPDGQQTNVDAVAKAIASGQQAPLSAWAMSKPMGATIMSKVMEINPSYNAQDYSVGQASLKNFSEGKLGNQVRSFNAGLAHLDTLGQASEALNNGNIQLFNKIGNAVAQQTGSPAPTNFEGIKQVVGNEIVKAIVGSGGGVADREKAQDTISKASSPAQLQGVINSYKTLMTGQLAALQLQYEQGTKRKDFERFLEPSAQALLKANTSGAPAARVIDFNSLPK